jgi:hypothetical protein
MAQKFVSCREFYYIQMEKYARQALAEGVKSPEDIVVTTDSELYRVLNLHYNRNNQIEVGTFYHIILIRGKYCLFPIVMNIWPFYCYAYHLKSM